MAAVYFSPHNVPLQHFDENKNPAANFVLHAFESGASTTPKNMFRDNSGTSAGTSITLDSQGYTSSSGVRHPVWLDASVNYRLELRDATDVTVVWQADNVKVYGGADSPTILENTVATMKANSSLIAGDVVRTLEHTTNYGHDGGNLYLARAVTAATDDNGSVIKSTGNTAIEFIGLFPGGIYRLEHWGVAKDDATNDKTAITNALTYVSGLGGGDVYGGVGGYYLGNDATGVTIPNRIKLIMPGIDAAYWRFAGSGAAVVITGAVSQIEVHRLGVRTTVDTATSFHVKDGAQHITFYNCEGNGNQAATNTGEGWFFSSTSGFTGKISLYSCQAIGNKYGIRVTGNNLNTDTVSTVSIYDSWLIGRSAGKITGSAGIRMEANANMVGSVFVGGTIEEFVTGIEHIDGGPGISFLGDMENNTTRFSVGESYNGEIHIPFNGERFSRGTNASVNLWWQEQRLLGNWYSESYYDRTHNIDQGSGATRRWGVTRGVSEIDGGVPRDKFVVSLGSPDSQLPESNWMKFQEHKITFGTSTPTSGSWPRSSIIFDATATAGASMGWMVTDGGTFGTATDNTGDTDGSTGVITGMTDTSDFNVGDVVNISAGFSATTNHIILSKTSTSITVDSNSNSVQSNVTVDTQDPTFKAMPNLAA